MTATFTYTLILAAIYIGKKAVQTPSTNPPTDYFVEKKRMK
jgi:hypothetical protein